MITLQELENNINLVKATITNSAHQAGRNTDDITLVAVTKTIPVERIIEAYNLGITNFGENYLQEALPKIEAFHPHDVSWHMIGHLQSNKASKVIPNFEYIHTIDSLKLAQKINHHVITVGKKTKILLQVNISGETSKNGISRKEILTIAQAIAKCTHLELVGLMTIPPFSENPEVSRLVFRSLRLLRDELQKEVPNSQLKHLSIGMSHDYAIAIEEGATIVRIGQALFGTR